VFIGVPRFFYIAKMASHITAADAEKVGGFSGLDALALEGVELFHDGEEVGGVVFNGGGYHIFTYRPKYCL